MRIEREAKRDVNELAQRILRGDILKTLYYQGAFGPHDSLGSLMLWGTLCEAGHREAGGSLSRGTLERFVDALGEKGFLRKKQPGALGRLLTDYEVHLTRRGRGLLEGAVPEDPDILTGEL
ncbi:MAG: hypothetical protein O2807_05955 [bacterium]|nr:hypothetical protein [bacterium]